MDEPRTYPSGVPCWIDIEPIDAEAAQQIGQVGWMDVGGDVVGLEQQASRHFDEAEILFRRSLATIERELGGQHPDVEVQIVDAGGPQMVEMLEKGDLEVAIVGVPGELPESLHQLPIFEERFVILLPPNHRLVAFDEIPAAELDQEPYVSRSNCEVFEPVRKELNGRGVFLRQVFSSPRDDWVQGMIKAGLGLGFFPEFSVTDPDLVVRPLINPSFNRTIYLTTVRGRPHSPAVGAFVQEARRYRWPTTRLPAGTSETIVVGQQVMAVG